MKTGKPSKALAFFNPYIGRKTKWPPNARNLARVRAFERKGPVAYWKGYRSLLIMDFEGENMWGHMGEQGRTNEEQGRTL